MNLVENMFRKTKKNFIITIYLPFFLIQIMLFVGLTEADARKKYKEISVFTSSFRPLKLSLSKLNEKVFIKLIVNKLNDKILGLHYLGENAAEIIQGFSVAVVKGLKKADLDETIGIHPTSAEEIVTLKSNN